MSAAEVRESLGAGVFVEVGGESPPGQQLGTVLGAAAIGTAYRSYSGRAALEDGSVPIKIGLLALVFAGAAIGERTFAQVASASHLRTRFDSLEVSVETVTAPNGLVSYWAYLYRGAVLAIATLDSLDPVRVSMTEFRSLVTRFAAHLEQTLGG
jgi:hypothetical protein